MKLKLEGEVDLRKPAGSLEAEAIQILVNTLGASESEAEQAVEKAQEILGESASRENLIAQALRYIRN